MGTFVESGLDYLTLDRLTGLPLRSKLLADLAEAVAPDSAPTLLALFALEGFREFEELYGVLEARKLMRRLADRLVESLGGVGSCYRPRGDEFAVLADRPVSVTDVIDTAVAALGESDRYYSVVARGGYALLPVEASEPIEALMVADRRLWSASPRRRAHAGVVNAR